jgi:hypothetical protein
MCLQSHPIRSHRVPLFVVGEWLLAVQRCNTCSRSRWGRYRASSQKCTMSLGWSSAYHHQISMTIGIITSGLGSSSLPDPRVVRNPACQSRCPHRWSGLPQKTMACEPYNPWLHWHVAISGGWEGMTAVHGWSAGGSGWGGGAHSSGFGYNPPRRGPILVIRRSRRHRFIIILK